MLLGSYWEISTLICGEGGQGIFRSSSSHCLSVRDSPIPTHPDSFQPPRTTPQPSRHTRTLALPSTVKTQSSATPPAPAPSSLRVPSHSMTPDPADPRNIAHQHVVGELSVLCPQVLDLVGLMTRGCEPCGNCIVSTFLCPDYVIRCPVYKSDPLDRKRVV